MEDLVAQLVEHHTLTDKLRIRVHTTGRCEA